MRVFRQFDHMDCGAACIKMIASHFGADYSIDYLRSLSKTSRSGVSILGIKHCLDVIGISSQSFKIEAPEISRINTLPCILFWQQNHFVVLYKIKRKEESTFYIADPAFGKRIVKESELISSCVIDGKIILITVAPNNSFSRHTNEKHQIIPYFCRLIKPFRREWGQLALGLLFGILFSLSIPLLTQLLVDKGVGAKDISIVVLILLSQLILEIGYSIIKIISRWIELYIGFKIRLNIVSEFLLTIMGLPIAFFENRTPGDIIQRIKDNNIVEEFASSELIEVLFSFLSFLVYFLVISFYDLKFLLVYVILSAISIVWIYLFMPRRKKVEQALFMARAETQNVFTELSTGISEIKLHNLSEMTVNKWGRVQKQSFSFEKEGIDTSQLQNTGALFINKSRDIIISIMAATSVINDDISLGMMMSISYIVSQMSGPLGNIIHFLSKLQDLIICFERSSEVKSMDQENHSDAIDFPIQSDIIFDKVFFSYDGNINNAVLKNLNIVINEGEVIALVGKSGRGKSTIVKLLAQLYQPNKGSITIGSVNISSISVCEYRNSISFVMQDGFIFSDTIKNNIILNQKFDEELFKKVVSISRLSSFIDSLYLGCDTPIGYNGTPISGGEKQRILIARAIYKQPRILVLDEATSSLDSENESSIIRDIKHEFRGRVTIVISAHRLSTVVDADQIIVIEKGSICEKGTHSSLLMQQGTYYKLIHKQLSE